MQQRVTDRWGWWVGNTIQELSGNGNKEGVEGENTGRDS